jgi:hypothetical protein
MRRWRHEAGASREVAVLDCEKAHECRAGTRGWGSQRLRARDRNRDGSTVAYYALAENAWNADAKRAEARVVHSFGRADQTSSTARHCSAWSAASTACSIR